MKHSLFQFLLLFVCTACAATGYPRPRLADPSRTFHGVSLLHLDVEEAGRVKSRVKAGELVFFRSENGRVRPLEDCVKPAAYDAGLRNTIEGDPAGDVLSRATVGDFLGEDARFTRGSVSPLPEMAAFLRTLKPIVTRKHHEPIQYVTATLENRIDSRSGCAGAEFVALEIESGEVVATTGVVQGSQRYNTYATNDSSSPSEPVVVFRLGGPIGCDSIQGPCDVPLAATLIRLPLQKDAPIFPDAHRISYESRTSGRWGIGSAIAPLCVLPCSLYAAPETRLAITNLAGEATMKGQSHAVYSVPKGGETRIGLCEQTKPKTSRVASASIALLGVGLVTTSILVLADVAHDTTQSRTSAQGSASQVAATSGGQIGGIVAMSIVGIVGAAAAAIGTYEFFHTERVLGASPECVTK